VCHGPSQCPGGGDAVCVVCGDDALHYPDEGVSVCGNQAWAAFNGSDCGRSCTDGSICVKEFSGGASYFCAPFDLGILFAQNGGGDRVRYADMGLWTGAPLPEPSTCPAIAAPQLCGANCGPCPPGETCTGRSPKHPYGFCGPRSYEACAVSPHSCGDPGSGCMTYTVEPQAQMLANQWGICRETEALHVRRCVFSKETAEFPERGAAEFPEPSPLARSALACV
jgi:hypothetical protein